MKQRLLSVIAMMTVTFGMQAAVGDNLTAKFLKNADFSADQPVEAGICTYDYDMANNATTLFGMQAVENWEASNLTDNTLVSESSSNARTDGLNARAAGVFAINADETVWLGSNIYLAPMTNPNGDATGNALGMVSVWGATSQYTQAVTLPAGAYRIILPIYNGAGTAEVSANLCGFVADDGTSYLSTKKTWDVEVWKNDTIEFLLEQATSGVISLGYTGPGGSGSMPHLFIDQVIIEEGDADALHKAEVDAAKVGLLEVIQIGEAYGVDTSEAQAVYDNPNVTVEQVLAAIENQKKINENGTTDFSDFFIQNPHFSKDDAVDSEIYTYSKDMDGQVGGSNTGGWGIGEGGTKRYGAQHVTGWTVNNESDNIWFAGTGGATNGRASGVYEVGSDCFLGGKDFLPPTTMSDGATEGKVLGMVTCWTGTIQYKQYVTIPAGKYILSISYYNSGGANAIEKNLIGFIADDGTEYLCTNKTFPVGKWTHETIEFELIEETSGNFSMGYTATNTGSGNMPHFFIDGISLTYIGTGVNPSLLALQAAVRNAEQFTAFNDGQFEEAIRAKVEEAYQVAEELVSSNSKDDEANTNAASALNNIASEASASRNAYNTFYSFFSEKVTAAIDKYVDNSSFTTLVEQLEDMQETYEAAYEEGTYTTAQINEAIAGFDAIIVNAVKEALAKAAAEGGKQNVDISALFNNIDYANSTVTGWQNETGTTAYLSRVQTAEVWNQNNFNVYQTLADMPKGVYEISTNGFYRAAANQSNYTQFEAETVTGMAYLYANQNQTLLNNVALYAVSAPDENHTAGIVTAEGDSLWVPNSNNNAHWLFYDQEEAKNTVTTALVEDGNLTIGIKGVELEGDEWTCWGAFTVVYKGAEGMEDALDGQIDVLIATATNIFENAQYGGVAKAGSDLENAIDNGLKAQEADAVETKTAAIAQLQEAIAYAQKSPALAQRVNEEVMKYDNRLALSEIDADMEIMQSVLDEVAPLAEESETNEQLIEAVQRLKDAWVAYVLSQSGMESASGSEPVNVTELLENADFADESNHAAGWTIETEATSGNRGTWDAGFLEFWNVPSAWKIYQKVQLKEGYYRLSCNALYRPIGTAAVVDSLTNGIATEQNMFLYAGNDNAVIVDWHDTSKGAFMNEVPEFISTQKYGINETDTLYAPNTRAELATFAEQGRYYNYLIFQYEESMGAIELGLFQNVSHAGDWAPFNNFQLEYLGTEPPVAVESLQADRTITNADNAIYNLAGQRLGRAQKGVNIIGNRKVVIR